MIRGARALWEIWTYIRTPLAIIYALFCALAIFMLSGLEYEWMIDDPYAGDDKLTLCTIPLSPDEAFDVKLPFCLVLVLVLLIPGSVRLVMKRRVGLSFAFGVVLLAFLVWRFWGRVAFCDYDGGYSYLFQ